MSTGPWSDVYDAALPEDAPGAWIRAAIAAKIAELEEQDTPPVSPTAH